MPDARSQAVRALGDNLDDKTVAFIGIIVRRLSVLNDDEYTIERGVPMPNIYGQRHDELRSTIIEITKDLSDDEKIKLGEVLIELGNKIVQNR